MLADIASGKVDAADWLFLIAAIVFVVAAVLSTVTVARPSWFNATALTNVGLALVAFAWVLL